MVLLPVAVSFLVGVFFTCHILGALSSGIDTHRYQCTQACDVDKEQALPVTYNVSSKMKCATECSKLTWCTMYTAAEPGSTLSGLLMIPCLLYMDAASPCSPKVWSESNARVCIKMTNESDPVSKQCTMVSQKVAVTIQSKPKFLVEDVYLRNLMSLGYSFSVQLEYTNFQYSFKVNYLKMGVQNSGSIFLYVLNYVTDDSLNVSVSSLSSDGTYLSQDSPAFPTPDLVYWTAQIPQSGRMTTNRHIFTTRGDRSAVITALQGGADIKLLFTNDNMLVHADVILIKNNKEIAVQTRVYENEQVNLWSHLSNGSTEIITWKPASSAVSGPTSSNLTSKWLACSCWEMVYRTTNKTLAELKLSVDSGRRIRVRIFIDGLVILSNADYLQINTTSGAVTAFLLRVLVQKSFLLDTVGGLLTTVVGGTPPSSIKWTHYLISSDGKAGVFTTTVGSTEAVCSSVMAEVEWFAEVGCWERVHSSDRKNLTSLALLAGKVLAGSEVRVKVQAGEIQKWFSCDTIKVLNRGQEVICHISSQVSANNGDSNSILSSLGSAAGSKSCTIRSECFMVTASSISQTTTSSCLWPSTEAVGNSTQLDNVEWFVSRRVQE